MKTEHREEDSTEKKREKRERDNLYAFSGHTNSCDSLYKHDHFQIIC